MSAIAVIAAALAAMAQLVAMPSDAGAASPVRFSVGDASVVEGEFGTRTIKIPVTLSDASLVSTSITYSITAGTATAGTDFTQKLNKVLTFNPGITKKPIAVVVTGDSAVEANETVIVTLSNPTGGAVLGRAGGTATILNDDANAGVKVSVGDVSVVEGDSGGGTSGTVAQFAVTLNVAAPSAMSVLYTTSPGTAAAVTDYTTKSGTISFAPGKYKKYVTVKITRDTTYESDEAFSVVLSSPSLGLALGRSTATGTIIDDDTPPAPATPVITATSPTSPGTTTTPNIVGTSTAGSTVSLFLNGTCAGAAAATGSATTFSSSGITLAVPALVTSTISARATLGGPNSACSTAVSYSQVDGGPNGLWGFGRSQFGAVGDGTTNTRVTPLQISSETWSAVAGGGLHGCGIKTTGTMWCWGYNNYGGVGDGTTTTRLAPVQVGVATDWASVTGGVYHTCGLKSDGTIWCWGANSLGELGDGTTTERHSPVQAGTDTDWVSVTAGSSQTCATKAAGTLWCWGYNSNGQVGDGSTTNRTSPVQVGTDADWASASAGTFHSCARKAGGTVWCWGLNASGQLGDGTTTERHTPVQTGAATDYADVSAGGLHTCTRKTDGSLWCWGRNADGQLGDGTTTNKTSPVQVATATDWYVVSGGNDHTCAIKTDGGLWCWGRNADGQLGDGTTTNRTSPTQVGTATTWVAVGSGGTHTHGIQNEPPSAPAITATDPVSPSASTTPNVIGTAPASVSVDLFVDVSCSGAPAATGTTAEFETTGVAVSVPAATTSNIYARASRGVGAPSDCSAGFTYTHVPPPNNELWSFGRNETGALGNGSLSDQSSPGQVGSDTDWTAISTTPNSAIFGGGLSHSCGVRAGTLWCWGDNNNGELGDGTTTRRTSPTQVGSDTDWATVGVGAQHTCGTRTDGTLWCWGRTLFGRLGDGTSADGSVTTPLQIGVDTDWASVEGGQEGTCALKTDGSLWCWGYNAGGQVGDGTVTDRLTPVQVGTDTDWEFLDVGALTSCALKTDQTMWCWGDNTLGGFYFVTPITTAHAPTQIGTSTWDDVGVGAHHACAIESSGTMWCWGWNAQWQLGDGTTTDRTAPTQIGTDSDWAIVSVSRHDSCAIKLDGTLWCWGWNVYGEHGNGTTANAPAPAQSGTDTNWIDIQLGRLYVLAIRT